MKKHRNNKVAMSTFICPECNNVAMMLPRTRSIREKNHIKDLYCPWCKTEVKCKEIREKRDAYKTLSGEYIYN